MVNHSLSFFKQNVFAWLAIGMLLSICIVTLAKSSDVTKEQKTNSNIKTAIFAGGCFWCMEPPFDKLDGVIATESGYTGGQTKNPTYKQVTYGDTGHYEAIKVSYDSTKIDYETLLIVFWHNVDPLDGNGQFCDVGNSYRAAIFYMDDEQKKLAVTSKLKLNQSNYFGSQILTPVISAKQFYPAEDYHQDYYQKNPIRYNYYRFACGRDKRLKQLWKSSAGIAGTLIPKGQLKN